MKSKKKSQKQPNPKAGFEFTGWATFNWGISYNQVFRTRKDAQDSCIDRSNGERYKRSF